MYSASCTEHEDDGVVWQNLLPVVHVDKVSIRQIIYSIAIMAISLFDGSDVEGPAERQPQESMVLRLIQNGMQIGRALQVMMVIIGYEV